MISQRQKNVLICAAVGLRLINKETKKKRTTWQKNWMKEGDKYNHIRLLTEIRNNNPEDYRQYLRMDVNMFDELLNLVQPFITKKDTHMRRCIPPKERIIATLTFLVTGRTYEDLKFSTCISAQALGYVIPETCRVPYEVLKGEYMKVRILLYKFLNYILLQRKFT